MQILRFISRKVSWNRGTFEARLIEVMLLDFAILLSYWF